MDRVSVDLTVREHGHILFFANNGALSKHRQRDCGIPEQKSTYFCVPDTHQRRKDFMKSLYEGKRRKINYHGIKTWYNSERFSLWSQPKIKKIKHFPRAVCQFHDPTGYPIG